MNEADQAFLLPSPLERVYVEEADLASLEFYIKRDDLIHPWLSGNKYRKLKYNLQKIKTEGIGTLITFGGPFSNHLYAAAGACALMDIKGVGIVRGEVDAQNPTLRFCFEHGMDIFGTSRDDYRLKEKSKILATVATGYPDYTVLPEGGTNELAMPGCMEMVGEIRSQLGRSPDYIVLSAGTGGTAAGILMALPPESRLIVFPALKTDHMYDEILKLSAYKNRGRVSVISDFHFGGYAKVTDELLDFITLFWNKTGVPLEHIYTAKAMYGLLNLTRQGFFKPGSTIVFVHTGGLQGLAGLEYLTNKRKTG